jgi:hypothetical protein
MMFASAPKLFSIGTISLPLDVVNAVIVNIVQIEITTNIASSIVNTIIDHKDNLETIGDKKNCHSSSRQGVP